VDGVDLEVQRGETFGLLGPNGAGKTTTVGVCTTRVRPTAGKVIVAGHDVLTSGLLVRRAIGVVTQSNTLDRSCSVADNLYYHCRFFGMSAASAKSRTYELLQAFSLITRAGAPPRALSGGMVQRLQIARAVAHRPAVLFLDEPTTGLDPQSRLALWDQLDMLRSDGTTVFLTTHYMEEADRLCDRVAVMDQGRVLVTGSPSELKKSCAAETSIEVSVARPTDLVEKRLGRLAGVSAVQQTVGGYRITTTVGSAGLSQIVPAATEAIIRDITISETTLETVFIELTGRELRD
jgi:ABC-2 type transport system ATP-binding protein